MKTINLLWIAVPVLLAGQLAVVTEAPLRCEPLGPGTILPASDAQAISLMCERAATVDALEASMLGLQRQLTHPAQAAQAPELLAQVVALHSLKTECLVQVEQLKLRIEKPTSRLATTEHVLA